MRVAESEQVVEDREKARLQRFRNRIELILAIGVLFALYVVVGGVLALFPFGPETMDRETVAWTLPVCAAVSALFLSVGIGVFRRREWARTAAVVLCWVSAAAFAAWAGYVAVGVCSIMQTVPTFGFPRRPLIAGLLVVVVIGLLCAYAMIRKGLYLRSDEAKRICGETGNG